MEKIHVGDTFIRYDGDGKETTRGKAWELTPGNDYLGEVPGVLIHWHREKVTYWYPIEAVAERIKDDEWGYVPVGKSGPLIGRIHDEGSGTQGAHAYGYKARRIGKHYYRFVWHYSQRRPGEKGVQVYRVGRPGDVQLVHTFGMELPRWGV